MENVAGPGSHPVAQNVVPLIKDAMAKMDPATALEELLLEKTRLERENEQKELENQELKKERDEAQAYAQKFEKYKDLIEDTRTHLPVYLRDKVLIGTLLGKIRDIYGRRGDVKSESEAGRKMAHRIVDDVMEVILGLALREWHKVKMELEVTHRATSR